MWNGVTCNERANVEDRGASWCNQYFEAYGCGSLISLLRWAIDALGNPSRPSWVQETQLAQHCPRAELLPLHAAGTCHILSFFCVKTCKNFQCLFQKLSGQKQTLWWVHDKSHRIIQINTPWEKPIPQTWENPCNKEKEINFTDKFSNNLSLYLSFEFPHQVNISHFWPSLNEQPHRLLKAFLYLRKHFFPWSLFSLPTRTSFNSQLRWLHRE